VLPLNVVNVVNCTSIFLTASYGCSQLCCLLLPMHSFVHTQTTFSLISTKTLTNSASIVPKDINKEHGCKRYLCLYRYRKNRLQTWVHVRPFPTLLKWLIRGATHRESPTEHLGILFASLRHLSDHFLWEINICDVLKVVLVHIFTECRVATSYLS
jgi:hypothetical protein